MATVVVDGDCLGTKTNWALFKLVGSAAGGVPCAKVVTGASDWTLSQVLRGSSIVPCLQ